MTSVYLLLLLGLFLSLSLSLFFNSDSIYSEKIGHRGFLSKFISRWFGYGV